MKVGVTYTYIKELVTAKAFHATAYGMVEILNLQY